VCGAGSGGTITGLSRVFWSRESKVEMIRRIRMALRWRNTFVPGRLAMADRMRGGYGSAAIHPILDLSRVRELITITDAETFVPLAIY